MITVGGVSMDGAQNSEWHRTALNPNAHPTNVLRGLRDVRVHNSRTQVTQLK